MKRGKKTRKLNADKGFINIELTFFTIHPQLDEYGIFMT